MQTPLVGKCEQYLNGAWVDLSARVPWLATPVSISRGLDDSGAPTAGSMTLTMANDDGALTPGATVELRRNLIQNPRGTGVVAGWSLNHQWGGSGGSITVTTESTPVTLPDGTQVPSFRRKTWTVTPSVGAAIAWQFYGSNADRGAVTAGQTYTVQYGWRKSFAGTPTINRFEATFFDAVTGGTQIGFVNGPTLNNPAPNTWQQDSITFTVPAGATHVQVLHVLTISDPAILVPGVTFDATAALAEPDPAGGKYFDGGYSPDGAMAPSWTGTANASASILTGVGAYLVRWRPIRVSVWANGAWRQRFYGFVNSEVLSWPTGDAGHCIVTVTAIDVIARLATGSLRAISAEVVLATSPVAYWPLTDSGAPAANASGVTWVGLEEAQVGTGGEITWGGGTPLPSDASGGVLLKRPADDDFDNFSYLKSAGDFVLPANWALSVYFTPTAGINSGTIVAIGNELRQVKIDWDWSDRKCIAWVSGIDPYTGDPYSWLIGTSATAYPAGATVRETLTATSGGTYRLGSASGPTTIYDTWSVALVPSVLPPDVRVQVGTRFTPDVGFFGEVKHLAIWSGASVPSLPTNLMPSATTVSAWATQLAAWAGVPLAGITTRGTNRTVVTPAIEGATATAVLGDLARGSLGRIAADTAGGMVVTAWDHTLTPVTAPAGEIDPDVEWGADPDGSPTMVTMTWPDGATYRAIVSGERPDELPGVLPYTQGATVAEWTARVDTAIPRIPDAGYDLLTLPDATVQALCGLVVGGLITVPSLPGQLPSSSQTSIVDSVAETIGADQWMLKLATSADPRDRAFIVGDAVKGVVGAGYLAAPLGAGRGGADPWRAGETIDAAKLNARQYTGPMVQSGDLAVTPVANTDTSVTVTFPQTFPSLPRVVLTPNTGAPWTVVKGFSVASVSTTGFTLWFHRTNSDPYSFRWLAVV